MSRHLSWIVVGVVVARIVLANELLRAEPNDSTGRVWNCEFRTDGFRPVLVTGDGWMFRAGISAAGHINTVSDEKLFMTGSTEIMWLIPSLQKEWLPDDPEGTLVTLFQSAYRHISADKGFEAVHSAIPYYCAETSPRRGHGFVYLPYNRRGNEGQGSRLPPIVFLHGFGGNLLWNIWALKTEFPDRMILAPSGGVEWPEDAEAVLKYVDEMCEHVKNTFNIAVERPWLMALSQGGPAAFRVSSKAPHRFRGVVSLASWAENPAELRYPSKFPILMINGTKDRRVPMSTAESVFTELQRRVARIVMETMDGANHFFFLSRREEMARLIKNFWSESDARIADGIPNSLSTTQRITMADCVGKYRWRTSGRTIDFDLEWDGTFRAVQKPDKTDLTEGGGLVDEGKGTWRVRDGKLTITMSHVWAVAFWKEYTVTWIDDETITGVTATGITLESSKPLATR